MAAAVVPDGRADIFGDAVKALEKLIDRQSLQIGVSFERLIQVRDVSVVMFVVMNFHRHLIDVGLQRVAGVRERWKNVGQRTLLL